MQIFSKKIEVKPGVFRNVHIRSNGRSTWVIAHQGKLVAVSGFVVQDKFVANPKWQYVIDAYVPKRVTSKGDAVIKHVCDTEEFKQRQKIKYNQIKQLPEMVISVGGHLRKVSRRSPTTGTVNFKGHKIPGTIQGRQFVPNPKWTNYWDKINQLG